ncbi:hypothetical protein ACFQX6_40065 [Streptosporangium lutulentum]
MTRWLDDDEQRTWRAFMATSQLVHEELDRQLQRDSGMPHAYYAVLVKLSEAPDRTLRMSELATELNSSQSALARGGAAGGARLGAAAAVRGGQARELGGSDR